MAGVAPSMTGGIRCEPASGYSQCMAYAPGSTPTATQMPATGWHFGSWSGGRSVPQEPATV